MATYGHTDSHYTDYTDRDPQTSPDHHQIHVFHVQISHFSDRLCEAISGFTFLHMIQTVKLVGLASQPVACPGPSIWKASSPPKSSIPQISARSQVPSRWLRCWPVGRSLSTLHYGSLWHSNRKQSYSRKRCILHSCRLCELIHDLDWAIYLCLEGYFKIFKLNQLKCLRHLRQTRLVYLVWEEGNWSMGLTRQTIVGIQILKSKVEMLCEKSIWFANCAMMDWGESANRCRAFGVILKSFKIYSDISPACRDLSSLIASDSARSWSWNTAACELFVICWVCWPRIVGTTCQSAGVPVGFGPKVCHLCLHSSPALNSDLWILYLCASVRTVRFAVAVGTSIASRKLLAVRSCDRFKAPLPPRWAQVDSLWEKRIVRMFLDLADLYDLLVSGDRPLPTGTCKCDERVRWILWNSVGFVWSPTNFESGRLNDQWSGLRSTQNLRRHGLPPLLGHHLL